MLTAFFAILGFSVLISVGMVVCLGWTTTYACFAGAFASTDEWGEPAPSRTRMALGAFGVGMLLLSVFVTVVAGWGVWVFINQGAFTGVAAVAGLLTGVGLYIKQAHFS